MLVMKDTGEHGNQSAIWAFIRGCLRTAAI
jgi:hypothetical protein